jgi:hypothetical protein
MSKIAKVKRAGGMAQMIEHLPSQFEDLSSNPGTAKTNKQTNKLLQQKDCRLGLTEARKYEIQGGCWTFETLLVGITLTKLHS